MMENDLKNDPSKLDTYHRTIGLAGVFQAAILVKQLAKTGRAPDNYLKASIESLFKIDALDALDVYGGGRNLCLGLRELIKFFNNSKAPKDSDIARYVLSLLHLERKLSKNPNMQKNIQTGITRASLQAHHFSSTHENVMANLASLYTDTLSTFKFRIYVTGEPLYLNQTHHMHKIRALLLAGVRSAVLWRQLGGKRWHLLISRHNMLTAARHCLKLHEQGANAELEEQI